MCVAEQLRLSGLVAFLGIPFPTGLLMLPQCPEGCLVHPSNTALRYLPELLSPAPLRCGVGKGTPNSVVNVLHAHKTTANSPAEFEYEDDTELSDVEVSR